MTAFSTSTALTAASGAITDVALMIGGTIAAILAIWAALTGLGFALRKFRQHSVGRKF